MQVIQLTTPFDPGDLDATDYAQINIVAYSVREHDEKIAMRCEYGNTVSGDWITGSASPTQSITIENIDGGTQHYDAAIAELPSSGSEKICDGLKRVLLEWLIAENHFAGTIV